MATKKIKQVKCETLKYGDKIKLDEDSPIYVVTNVSVMGNVEAEKEDGSSKYSEELDWSTKVIKL